MEDVAFLNEGLKEVRVNKAGIRNCNLKGKNAWEHHIFLCASLDLDISRSFFLTCVESSLVVMVLLVSPLSRGVSDTEPRISTQMPGVHTG